MIRGGLWQVEITSEGVPVIDRHEALRAVEQVTGQFGEVHTDGVDGEEVGIWLVELPAALEIALQTAGYLDLTDGEYRIEAETP